MIDLAANNCRSSATGLLDRRFETRDPSWLRASNSPESRLFSPAWVVRTVRPAGPPKGGSVAHQTFGAQGDSGASENPSSALSPYITLVKEIPELEREQGSELAAEWLR